jgi:hypothetical protein
VIGNSAPTRRSHDFTLCRQAEESQPAPRCRFGSPLFAEACTDDRSSFPFKYNYYTQYAFPYTLSLEIVLRGALRKRKGGLSSPALLGNMSDDGRAKSRNSLDVSGGRCCAEPLSFFRLGSRPTVALSSLEAVGRTLPTGYE